jgi:hypothetical protein
MSLPILSFAFAILGYLSLCSAMLKTGAVQPISSTMLWFCLNAITAVVAFNQDGSFLLAAGYVCGTVLTTGATAYKKTYAFAKSDLPILGLVIACLVIWRFGTGDMTIIASASAAFIAGLPLVILYWKHPQQCDKLTWSSFLLANLCSLLGAESSAINQWFFATSSLLFSLIVLAVSFRKITQKEP